MKYACSRRSLSAACGTGELGLLGQPQQAVGEQRVGAQGTVHAEVETVVGGRLGDAVDDRPRLLGATELAGVGLEDRLRPARRRGRVELVRAVDDVELDLAVEFGRAARSNRRLPM